MSSLFRQLSLLWMGCSPYIVPQPGCILSNHTEQTPAICYAGVLPVWKTALSLLQFLYEIIDEEVLTHADCGQRG